MITKRSGFTLIEIVIAIMLVGLFSIMVGPKMMDLLSGNREKKAALDIKGFKNAIEMYMADIGSAPAKLIDLVQKPTSGEGANKWRRPFINVESVTIIDGQPADPWNNPYHYRPTRGAKHPYELYSDGDPDNPLRIDAWEK